MARMLVFSRMYLKPLTMAGTCSACFEPRAASVASTTRSLLVRLQIAGFGGCPGATFSKVSQNKAPWQPLGMPALPEVPPGDVPATAVSLAPAVPPAPAVAVTAPAVGATPSAPAADATPPVPAWSRRGGARGAVPAVPRATPVAGLPAFSA